jgi:outer membrane murein-binding lipoprotein Lpp
MRPLSAVLLSALLLAGCGGVSEDELNKIKEENMALAAELESERRKADILNQALAAAYEERDRLVEALEAPIEPPEEEASAEAEAAPEPPRVYSVKSGDTLSQIAAAHQTTTSVLVSLNPYLRDRRDLMVWENDKINLPPPPR